MQWMLALEEQNDVIAEQGAVKLMEPSENVFVVEFDDAGQRVRVQFLTWAEAEANFVRRVEEEDYR